MAAIAPCSKHASRPPTRKAIDQSLELRNSSAITKIRSPGWVNQRRIIEVIKSQEEVGSDLREELQQLGREKEQILTVVEKVQVDIDRRQMKVIDADLIRQSLVDFERLANLLPPDDQKELFHLLLRQVEVWPFDPEQGASPEGAAGAFATKVRSKWYRVAVTLNQLPGLGLSERFSRRSSDLEDGSPKRVIFRTASNSTLPFTLIAAGRESTVNGATAFLGMSHLNHCGRPLRASAGVLIR